MDPLVDNFHKKINRSGWIEQSKFREMFLGISNAAFTSAIGHPFLFGDSVANIEVVDDDGKASLRFSAEQNSSDRVPLNYIFPFVSDNLGKQSQDRFFIGSSSENKFIIPDYTVSRRHAVITKKRSGYYLKDMQSEFGSYVNGVSFGSKEVLLNDGDHVSFGRYQFLFLEPQTVFAHLFDTPKRNPEVAIEEIALETVENLQNGIKETLDENSEYVAECIAKHHFENIDERLMKILSFIPFFNAFSVYEKRLIVSFHNKLILAAPKEIIVQENDISSGFFIILKGGVDVIKTGSLVALNSLGPGNSFGEAAFLLGLPRSANVVAQESTIMFTIDREFFENIGVEIREKLKDQIIRQIAANIVRQNREIKEHKKENVLSDFKVYRKRGSHTAVLSKNESKKIVANFIDHAHVFQKFSKYQKAGLAVLVGTVEIFDAGEIILKEYTLHSGICFIVEGSVYITVTKDNVVLSELKRGDFFGEISTFGKKTTSANVIAKEKTTIMQITLDDLHVMAVDVREKLKDVILAQILKRQTDQNLLILNKTE